MFSRYGAVSLTPGGLQRPGSQLKDITFDDAVSTLRGALAQQEQASTLLPAVPIDIGAVNFTGTSVRFQAHAKHTGELVTSGVASKLADSDTDTLDAKLKHLEPKYRFYQELWHFVGNMLACLDSKLDDIEECELQMLELEKASATVASERLQNQVTSQHCTTGHMPQPRSLKDGVTTHVCSAISNVYCFGTSPCVGPLRSR